MTLQNTIDWLAGNGAYMTLEHCMAEDWFWIWALCSTSASVMLAYLFIALHALGKYRQEPKKSASSKLLILFFFVFVLCGLCGYGFNLIRLVWPGYRLFVLLQTVLAAISWWFYIACKHEEFFAKLFSVMSDGPAPKV